MDRKDNEIPEKGVILAKISSYETIVQGHDTNVFVSQKETCRCA